MASLLDLKKKIENLFNAGNSYARPIPAQKPQLPNLIQNTKNYFDPTKATRERPGFWNNQGNPVANFLAKPQNFRIPVSQKFSATPQSQPNTFLRTAQNIGAGIVDETVNLPQRFLEGGNKFASIKRDNAWGDKGRVLNATASVALPFLDTVTLGGGTLVKGVGKQAVKETAKAGLKQVIKRGALKGGATGTLYGALYGASQGEKADPLTIAQSATAGGLFGLGLGGGSSLVGGLAGLLKKTPQAERELVELASKQPRLPNGQFTYNNLKKPKYLNKHQWEYQLAFNKKYNRNPYEIVYHDDVKRAVSYELEKKGAGLSIRDVSKDKNPLGVKVKPQEQIKKEAREQLQGPGPLPWETKGYKPTKVSEPDIPSYSQNDLRFQAAEAYSGNKKSFNQAFDKWIAQRDLSRTTSTQIGSKFKDIPSEKGLDVIKAMETPTGGLKKDVKNYVVPLHREFDRLYNEAKKTGIDIGYRENYITHIWDRPQDEVQELYKVLKQREGFQNERSIPTYEEGIRMGLKPKFTSPAQIIAQYSKNLERLKANLNFFKELKAKGLIVDASVGTRNPGFVPIEGVGFPRSISKGAEGNKVIGNYYATPDIAKQVNKVFQPENTGLPGQVLDVTGKVSGVIQDVGLSGGIPKTPVNAFTIAQMTKEMAAGRIKSPIVSAIRSISGGKSNKFFEDNVGAIKKMQERNIPVRSSFEISELIDQDTVNRTLGENIGRIWGQTMNDPTFKRFMPMLQVNLFNDIEKQALKGGKTKVEAADIAAQAVKKFYGLIDTGTEARRSKIGQDVLKTVTFAPKFRESMIRFWVENIRALGNPLALENRTNIKFMGGAALGLGAMNFLNQTLNGHGMLDNPPGKEDKLLIPLGKLTGNPDDKTVIGIPFLSSIATIPRAIFRQMLMVGRGDISEAGRDAFQSYASMGLKPIADVVANQDYFGDSIVEDSDSPMDKFKKQGGYLATQYLSHPYLKEGGKQIGNVLGGKEVDPLYQITSRASELPLRFYNSDSLAKSTFYDEYYALKPIVEQFDKLKYQDPQKAQAFYTQNKDKLNRFEEMKTRQSAYYDRQDQTGKSNIEFLIGNNQPGQAQASQPSSDKEIYFYKNKEGNSFFLDMNKYDQKLSGVDKVKQDSQKIKDAKYIWNSDLSQQEKESIFNKLGFTSEQVRYESLTSLNEEESVQYIQEKNLPHDKLLESLLTGRMEGLSGSMFVTNGVLDELEDRGLINDAEAKALKRVKFDKNGNNIVSSSGSSKKGKAITIKKLSAPKITFSNTKVGSAKSIPTVKLSSGPVKVKPDSRRKIIKIKTPEKSVSYRIITPQKVKGLDSSIKLV